MKTRILALLLAAALTLSLAGCGGSNGEGETSSASSDSAVSSAPSGTPVDVGVPRVTPPDDNVRTWYEVFVYSFCDSDGDGVGDLPGLTSKLDYIADLGFNGIWLMPIHPSPTYHKYDVTDYYAIDPQYGTMEDFDAFLAACEERGIAVILDLVLNHTSAQHPWFRQAVQALKDGDTQNPYVGYYHFVEGKPAGGAYYPAAGDWYYEGLFWDQMPDLDLGSEALRQELAGVVKFWLDKGVRGFRLDAVKEYYSGEASKNREVLSWLNGVVKEIAPDAFLVGEDWDESTGMYEYYDSGIDSFFNFPFAAASGWIARTLLDSAKTAEQYIRAVEESERLMRGYDPNGIAANFFTNHDSARAAGFMRRDPALIKTAWGMNLMQGGGAFVYYGEELGMSGSGKDENKRAPMLWTADRRAEGMCFGPPAMETQEHSFAPADAQASDPDSIYNYVKKAVHLRNAFPEIARGELVGQIRFSDPDIYAVEREWDGSMVTLLYNLSAETKVPAMPGESDFVYQYGDIKGWLSADNTPPILEGNTMTLPAYSITILR